MPTCHELLRPSRCLMTNGRSSGNGPEAVAPQSRLMRRARIVLRAADGWLNTAIAADLGVREKTVGLWRRRFAEQRTAGIQKDAPAGGDRRPCSEARSKRR